MNRRQGAALLATLVVVAAASPVAPTNEDVVRRFLTEPSVDAVIEWLDDQPTCRLDLSPPMLQELHEANLPASILDAMQRCNRRSRPDPAAASIPRSAPEPLDTGRLILRFASTEQPAAGEPWRNSAAVVTAREGESPERPPLPSSLALFVACLIPEHVPDHWRDKTPLNGASARRHHLLLFHEQTAEGRIKKQPLLYLTRPDELTVTLATDTHHLELGIAARIGDTWSIITKQDLETITISPEDPRELTLHLQTRVIARTLRLTLEIQGAGGQPESP